MVNIPAATTSLGMFLNVEGCDAHRLEEAFDAIQQHKFGQMRDMPKVNVVKEDDPSNTNMFDLNIKASVQ